MLRDNIRTRHFIILFTGLVVTACSGGDGNPNDREPADRQTSAYTIGGSVSGLNGANVVLQNNNADSLTLSQDGSFTFAAVLDSGNNYAVSVFNQPSNLTCTVTNASGEVTDKNITDILVACTENPPAAAYTIGGSVSGLTGSGLVLQNNGADNLSITTNGAFTFSLPIDQGNNYAVSVLSQAMNQTCTVNNDSGAVTDANITSVTVTCVDDVPPAPTTATINGTVAGTIIVAVDENGDILASDDTAGRAPNGNGNYAFSLTQLPIDTGIRVYFITSDGVYPMYFDSDDIPSPDSNVLILSSVVEIDLGFVNVVDENGLAIPTNNPAIQEQVVAGDENEVMPVNVEMVGTWGYARLRHNNTGTWAAQSGTFTYNADGSGVSNWQENKNNVLGTGGNTWDWRASKNPDGSITLVRTMADGATKTRRIVFSDDNKVMLLDGTDQTDRQRFRIAARMDPSKVYADTDLSGDYYSIGYMAQNQANRSAFSAITTFDGAGNISQTSIANVDGTISSDTTNHTYAISADGSIAFDGNMPAISGITADTQLMISGSSTVMDTWSAPFFMGRQDRDYTTADLAGTWAITSFDDQEGSSYGAAFGSMSCDAAGNCSAEFLEQRDGNKTQGISAIPTLQVKTDGSFGASLGQGVPDYAGAMGHDGNTLMFNTSLVDTGGRGIVVGVRCNTCVDLATGGGANLTQLTDDPGKDWHGYWSHDGNQIVFTSDRGGSNDIWVMDANGNNPIQLTTHLADDNRPFWNHDGTEIVFQSNRSGKNEIWKMNANGSSLVQLTNNPASVSNSHPAWSPDGTRIAFQSNQNGQQDIWTMNPDGSDLKQLTANAANDTHPMWKPDSSQITFARKLESNDIWIMNSDGSAQQALTTDPADEQHADWSPDGTRISFRSDKAGNYDVWIMNADGGKQQQLTTHPANDRNPDWHPFYGTIIFRSNRSGNQEIWQYLVPF